MKKIGEQNLQSRLMFMRNISDPWTKKDTLSNDELWRMMKKTLFYVLSSYLIFS